MNLHDEEENSRRVELRLDYWIKQFLLFLRPIWSVVRVARNSRQGGTKPATAVRTD